MATGKMSIISRSEWNARVPKTPWDTMPGPAQYVFIHHSAGATATDRDACIKQVKVFQDVHMNEKKYDDIGYSFVVGEDGNAYKGRGWTSVGAHTKKYNSVSIGICVIGNFNSRKPNSAAQSTVQRLIQEGVDSGHIKSDYTLKGHRDVGTTDCPGNSLYSLIQDWPRFAAKDKKYQ